MLITLREFQKLIGKVLIENDLSRRQMQLSSEAGEDRFKVFLQKINDESEFQVRNGEEIFNVKIPRIKGNQLLISALRAKDPDAYLDAFNQCCGGRGVKCLDSDGRAIYITNPNMLVKSEEFGGKGDGYFLSKENGQIEEIEKMIDSMAPVDILIRSNNGNEMRFDRVSSVKKLNNNDKADVALINDEGKPAGKISLKWSEEPVQMHQWGGVKHLLNDEEIDNFISDLKRRSKSKLKNNSFVREIQSDDIKLDSVFGCDHDVDGIDCNDLEVDAVIVGKDISMHEDEQGCLVISAPNVWLRGEIPDGNWEPKLWTVFNKSDKQRGASYGLPGVRVMTGPADWRKNNVEEI